MPCRKVSQRLPNRWNRDTVSGTINAVAAIKIAISRRRVLVFCFAFYLSLHSVHLRIASESNVTHGGDDKNVRQ